LIDIEGKGLVLGDALARAATAVSASAQLSRTVPGVSPVALPLRWALTGGEDHSLVAAFPPSAELPARWRVIGRVGEAVAGGRVTVDGARYEGPAGWEHFGATGASG
jgi:thiamine monophosphate kinase